MVAVNVTGLRVMRPVGSGLRHTWAPLVAIALASAVGLAAGELRFARLLVAAGLGAIAVTAVLRWPASALVPLLLALPFLALTRRLLLALVPWQTLDPLLVVAPIVAVLLVVSVFVIERQQLVTDPISGLCAALLALSIVQVINPGGGGLGANTAGLLFGALPLVWFFVGRTFLSAAAAARLLAATIAIGALASVYGLVQGWSGLPAWDREWVDQSGYTALNVGGRIRGFATFASSAEYGSYLAVVVALIAARSFARRRGALILVPLIATALVFSAGRSVFVKAVLACLVVIACRFGSPRRAALALVVAVSLVVAVFLGGRSTLLRTASTASDPLLSHQLAGIADPFGERSTATLHLSLFIDGVLSGVRHPLGFGLARTTIAGEELGGGTASSEIDVSNTFISLGFVGGCAYVALVVLVLRRALSAAVTRRDAVALGTVGLLVATGGQWLNGGYYALAPLIWCMIGHLVASQASVTTPPSRGPGGGER